MQGVTDSLTVRDNRTGAEYEIPITDGTIKAEVCSNCHPFYTGKQKILDTGGRVAKFEKRYGKK